MVRPRAAIWAGYRQHRLWGGAALRGRGHVRPGWGPENQMASEASRGFLRRRRENFWVYSRFKGKIDDFDAGRVGEILLTKHLSLKRCVALHRGRAGLGPRGVGAVQGRKARVSQAHHMAGEPTHGSNQACP